MASFHRGWLKFVILKISKVLAALDGLFLVWGGGGVVVWGLGIAPHARVSRYIAYWCVNAVADTPANRRFVSAWNITF